MQTLKVQLAKDIKHIAKKMSVKSWIVFGGFALVSIGLLVAMVASRQSSENRSGATGGGPQYYFSPAAAVLTKVGEVIQPIQNIQIGLTAGRPIVSYSFVMKLTYSDGTPVSNAVWNQVTFIPNQKFVTNQSEALAIPGAKLFAGTIGQQPGGVTTLATAVTDGTLGSFRFVPSGLEQPDLRMTFFAVPNKPQANSAYVLGRLLNPPTGDGEVVIPPEDFNSQFNLHNPFLAVGSPTPTPIAAVVSRATLQYAVSNGAPWNQLDARFNGFNNGGTVKSLIRVADIDPSWRVAGLSPAFRLRIKNAQGVYKQTTIGGQLTNVLVNFNPNGTLAEGTFWVNWKVVSNATELKFIQIPGTTDKLQFDPGDTIEVTINLRKEQNGVNYTCKENDELAVAPIGRPEEQQVMGPCVNDSLVTVTYGAGLAPGTCQCDIGSVTETACVDGTAAYCSDQVTCECRPTTASPTPTPTPTTGAGSQACLAPQGFTATAPNGGNCNADGTMTINYSWTPVVGATSYDLMISTSPDFSSGTYTWTGITASSVTKYITGATTRRYHRVRVSAKTGCTVPGAWSASASTTACGYPLGGTATPTQTQSAFTCPVILNQIPQIRAGLSLPTNDSNRFITTFTVPFQATQLISSKYSRIVAGTLPLGANPTVTCSSGKITTSDMATNAQGRPAVTQSNSANPCVLGAAGNSYVPVTIFNLTDGTTKTCPANVATVVIP